MYEGFFNLLRTPFARNMPTTELFLTPAFNELQARLAFAARTRSFCVVTGDVGVGKTTAVRRFVNCLDQNLFRFVYISDSALTPRFSIGKYLRNLLPLRNLAYTAARANEK